MLLDQNQIQKWLPHREPFLFVNEVVEINPKQSIKAIWRVDENAWFLKGHFPHYPIVPGVLQVEALAQTMGILVAQDANLSKDSIPVFAKIEHCKFTKKVLPPAELILEVHLLSFRHGICKGEGLVKYQNEVSCEATFLCKV